MSASTPRPRPTGSRQRPTIRGGKKATGRKKPKKQLSRKEQLLRLLKYGLIAGLVGVVMLVGIFYFAYEATTIPDPNAAFQTQTTKIYYADGKTPLGLFATQNRESIPLADVPQVMQDAVVAAEDRTFWTNKGIDPRGILRAAFSNAQGNATQGGSTITQQYVKLLYLNQERTLSRKIKEVFLSLKIQNQQSKSQILEGYLNTIYFGRGAYGIQAAANAFFGIPAKKLNLAQSAMLASVLNSPSYLSPDRSADSRAALLARYDYVLSGMVSANTITAAQEAAIAGKLPKVKPLAANNTYGGQKGFMLEMVKNELLKHGFSDAEIEGGGLRVTTTFTQKAMAAAKAAVASQRPTGLSDKNLHIATASIDVKTGALLGFYAGQDYLKSQLNWAMLGGSPGSAFKPFAVAAAIKDGFSLKSTFDGNSPYVFPNGEKVVNEGGGNGISYGPHVSLVKATQDSINTAFIDLTESMKNGPQKIKDMAVKLGIPADTPGLNANTGISLGSATISPINMANAYSTIADGGLHHDWFVVSKVTRASDGEVLYTADQKTDRVLDEKIAADTSYAMQQVVQAGTGRNAQRINRPAAGKTGTATNGNDDVSSSWFVGYTPQIATAVMYVRGKGNEALNGYLPTYFGANYPTYTWAALMSSLLEGLPIVDFPPPAYVTGKAPTTGHAPYTPPPKPKPTPKPTPTATPTPTPSLPPPTPTPTPTPPTPSSTPCGGLLGPPCPTPTPTPSP